jgi:eukaryotic-like serine/threonine-protein kinase
MRRCGSWARIGINHVAVSLETAHAAQLEVAVQAAHQQRDVAETLRSAMSQISQTLDPDEVLGRLLAAVARIALGDRACLLRLDQETLTVTAGHGPAAAAVGRPIDPATDPTLAELALSAQPVAGTTTAGQPAPLPAVLTGIRSWIAVPLATRDQPVGILLAGSTVADAYPEADVEVAAALAGQGMVAYENACLFHQARHLAATDTLTGTYNRRRFFELASRSFAVARARNLPLSAIMIDIDHFKQINDRHGHLIGDEVIREVTRRLLATVRETTSSAATAARSSHSSSTPTRTPARWPSGCGQRSRPPRSPPSADRWPPPSA